MEHYGFQGQFTAVKPIGIAGEGLRMDVVFAGQIVEGPAAGRPIEGVDYLVIRHDGVGVVDARELIGGDGVPGIAAHAVGYIVPPFEMPELSALVDPSFTWPDVDLPMHGSARLQTADPALAEVNRIIYGWSGSVNVARGVLEVHARSLATPQVHRPA